MKRELNELDVRDAMAWVGRWVCGGGGVIPKTRTDTPARWAWLNRSMRP